MPQGMISRTATPTNTRVALSDNSPTPGTKNTARSRKHMKNRHYLSTKTLDTADYQGLSERVSKIFSKKLLAILTGRYALLKEVPDCVFCSLKEISPYINWYWRLERE